MKLRYLKYYNDEDERIKDLIETKCTKEEARKFVAEFCSFSKLAPIELFIKEGTSYYVGHPVDGQRYILLGQLNVGTLIHEFAHYWDHMRAYMPIKPAPSKLVRTLERKRVLYHCKRHAALVDILANYVRYVRRGVRV